MKKKKRLDGVEWFLLQWDVLHSGKRFPVPKKYLRQMTIKQKDYLLSHIPD